MNSSPSDINSTNETTSRQRTFTGLMIGHLRHYTTGEWYYLGDLAWFAVLLLMFHFSYHAVADTFLALPQVQSIRLALASHISEVSYLICQWIGLEPSGLSNRTIQFSNGRGLTVIEGCSGFKQLLQSAFLFIFYPGNWRHKLWFVPGALVVVHLVNVLRISILTAWSGLNWPFWQWMHDYPLKGLYFLVIFALWYFWNERRRRHQLIKKVKPAESGS